MIFVQEQTHKEAETEEMVESFESEDVTPHATPTKHLTGLDQSSFDHGTCVCVCVCVMIVSSCVQTLVSTYHSWLWKR